MKRHPIRIDETIATVIVADEFVSPALEAVKDARVQLVDYILEHPEFESSLNPVSVSKKAPLLVRKMSEAGKTAGVGPMASVAGAIAEFVVIELVDAGANHVVFDNGGDIAMYLQRPIIAGIYAGPNSVDGLGLRISRTNEIVGLCTSSGTVGHSLSFGCSDAAITISQNVSLADAVATALGNSVNTRDSDEIALAMRKAMHQNIDGVMVIIGDAIGTCGRLPEIVHAVVDYNLISKG